ncbi:hypothetical protein FRC12_002760 [Ceratobasidium sp. 428]|nr:hypothetical protein FRC12_002760 [Ceratobasidium sp. 428]
MASDVSRVLANRGSSWSSGGDGTGPCFITFKNRWGRHRDPPFRWYYLQPCTRFQLIDHRRSRDSPFFHEFLVLKLANGSYCRVERTGEGSRLDAVSRAGSHAHDIIERITYDDYEQLDESSDIISSIRLPHVFDLLDILAICYAIQKHKHSSKYTLQRYNCYFFCDTILVILTRRLVGWEQAFTREHWNSTVNIALDELSNRSQAPLSEDSQRYILPRLCAMLDPESLQPTRFLLDRMRKTLNAESGDSFDESHEACASVLWGSSLENAVGIALQVSIDGAVEAAVKSNICPQTIRTALEYDHKDNIWNEPTYALVFATFSRKIADATLSHIDKTRAGAVKISKMLVDECVDSWTEYYSRCCRVTWRLLSCDIWEALADAGHGLSRDDSDVESCDDIDGGSVKSGLGVRASLSSKLNQAKYIFTGIWYFLVLDAQAALSLVFAPEGSRLPRHDSHSAFRTIYLRIKSICRAFLVKVEFLKLFFLWGSLEGLSESYEFDLNSISEKLPAVIQGIKDVDQLFGELSVLVGEDALLQTMNAMPNTISFGPGEWKALLMLGCIKGQDEIYETLEEWWWNFCKASLLRPILDVIHEQPQSNISVKWFSPLDQESSVWVPTTVVQFQKQIQSRIADHAIRVAATRLGAAEVVQQDIQSAIENVWTLLPRGHGPMVADSDNEGGNENTRTQ